MWFSIAHFIVGDGLCGEPGLRTEPAIEILAKRFARLRLATL